MSVESSKPRRNQQNDLSDLQSEYAQKKKKYTQQQEEELDGLKEFYTERKNQTRDQGEAAINHIRRKQGESVEAVAESRKKMADRSEDQLNGIDKDYRRKIAETQTKRQSQIDSARDNTKERVNEIQEYQSHKVENIRNQSSEEVKNIKEKFHKDITQSEAVTQKRLAEVKDRNEKALSYESEKGTKVKEKLQANLKKDYDTTKTHGEEVIAGQKEVQEKKLDRQDVDFEKRYDKEHEQWMAREHDLNETYQGRIGHNKKAYEDQLKDQQDRFTSVYGKNGQANKESLRIQNNNFLKEQVELKKKFFQSNEKFAGKEDDPFYKLQERGNRLRENSDFYIVEAYVPKHEKDNVKVVIKDDAASISGKRSFKDEIQEDGRKLSTDSYQTFREVFNFDKPVITEGMTRERDGDYVTFWVPKLNSFDGIRKLNKKA